MGEKKLTSLCLSFFRYGERQWKNKTDCWGTTALSCDLTNETLDLYEPYYGRVKTAWAGRYSAWSRTPRFTPWWESEFQPVACLFFSAFEQPLGGWPGPVLCWDPCCPIDGILRTTLGTHFYHAYLTTLEIWGRGSAKDPVTLLTCKLFNLLTRIHSEATTISLYPKAFSLPIPCPS